MSFSECFFFPLFFLLFSVVMRVCVFFFFFAIIVFSARHLVSSATQLNYLSIITWTVQSHPYLHDMMKVQIKIRALHPLCFVLATCICRVPYNLLREFVL